MNEVLIDGDSLIISGNCMYCKKPVKLRIVKGRQFIDDVTVAANNPFLKRVLLLCENPCTHSGYVNGNWTHQ